MTATTTRLLLIGAVALALSACKSGGPSDAPSAVTPGPTADKLTLSGVVTDNPIVNASVMVRVGTSEFAGAPATGSNGEFTLEIESQDGAALVTAEAEDAVNGVKLSAILDTFDGCRALARNGVVDGVKVTNVTTAQQVLAERLATDGSVDSFDEYAELAAQIDGDELFELAAALKVVIENVQGNVLPAGVTDTVELARAIAAGESSFLADLATLSPGALDEARNKLLTDGHATLPFEPVSAPGVYVSTTGSYAYAVFDNGTALADFFDDNPVPNTPSWALNDLGQIVVTYYGWSRQSDALSAIGQVDDVVHVVAGATDLNGEAGATTAGTVVKYGFGAAFDATDVAGTWADPMDEVSHWVFQADGSGYRLNSITDVQSDAFDWTVNAAGSVEMHFAESAEQMEITRLAADDMVLTVNRIGGQWAALNVTGFVQINGG